jgi:signal transduction histidine kinase
MVYLLKILNDLLDVQKIELGQLKLTKNLHDLAGIVEKTIDTMREDMAKKGISITINIQSNLVCLCDDVRIEQVLTNLLVNAVKFSTVGNGKISVKMYPENDWAKIIVKDNGIGINGDKLEQIFVKFYQMDNSSTREYGGTGLGLSVCKGLIENHGGKIWAESEGVNKGAEIHILLPLAK